MKKKEEGQVEKEGEQAFSNAFNEAATKGSEATAKKPEVPPASEAKEPTDEGKGVETETGIEKGKEGAEAQPPIAADTQGKEKAEEAAHVKTLDDKRKRGEALSDEETKTLYAWLEKEPLERRIHKHKTLEGMYNSETKKNRELQSEIERLKTEKPESNKAEDDSAAKDKGDKDFVSDLMKDPVLKAFSQDYDEIAPGVFKAVEIMHQRSMKAIEKALEAVMPVIETHEETAREKHFAAIEEKHPDFPKYRDSGELESWIDTLPSVKKKLYKEIYDGGTKEDVIEMVQDFRTAKGYKTVAPEHKEVDEAGAEKVGKKASAMEAVRSAKRPISVGSGAKKDDFSAGFAEASKN